MRRVSQAAAMSTFSQMFDEILRRELTSVLSRVAEGESLDLNYLVSTYLPKDMAPASAVVASKPAKRAAKVVVTAEDAPAICTALTAKGAQCSLKSVAGECMCRIHLKKAALDFRCNVKTIPQPNWNKILLMRGLRPQPPAPSA